MKLAFISIPKNASTSIQKCCGGLEYNHYHAKHVSELMPDYFNRFSFCIFRNPFDRLVSWYEHSKILNKSFTMYHQPFDMWVRNGCPHHWKDEPFFKYGKNPLNQYEFITYEGKIYVDKIFRFDDLPQVFRILKRPYTHVNNTNHGRWSTYYTNELKELVKEQFSIDIKIYNELPVIHFDS